MPTIFSKESIKSTFGGFLTAFLRFPLTLFCSLLGTLFFIIMATSLNHSKEIEKLAITFLLFLPLFLSVELFEERRITPRFLILILAVLTAILFYYFGSPEAPDLFNNKSFMMRYGVLIIVFHLLVSVAPFVLLNNPSGFWQFNKTLFINIFTAFLYSVTLSGGLVLAFSGVKNLFDLEISNDWYVYIWFGINGFFNTLIFTSKLPSLSEIEKENTYPIGLKYFTQYVLLTLVAIYLSILVAYEFKIALTWSLPKGWVSIMVLASAIFGILAFLLIYPLKETNRWIQTYTKLYYWILLPLVALMMVAIYVRIKQYGLTEPRYFVALLSVWLLCISLYFSISKVDNIKIIPLSLLIVGLLGIYAPFNAFQSSQINQEGRMVEVLEKNNLMKEGKISVANQVKLNSIDEDKIFAALEYLSQNQPDVLESYLSKSQYKELITEKSEINRSNLVLKMINLPEKRSIDIFKYFSTNAEMVFALENADFMISPKEYQVVELEALIDKDKFEWEKNKNMLVFTINDKEKISFELQKLAKLNANDLSPAELTFFNESSNYKLKLMVDGGGSRDGFLENIHWKLFLTKK